MGRWRADAGDAGWWAIGVNVDLRTALLEELAASAADDGFPVKPQRAIADLRAALDPQDIVVSDVGAHTRVPCFEAGVVAGADVERSSTPGVGPANRRPAAAHRAQEAATDRRASVERRVIRDR